MAAKFLPLSVPAGAARTKAAPWIIILIALAALGGWAYSARTVTRTCAGHGASRSTQGMGRIGL